MIKFFLISFVIFLNICSNFLKITAQTPFPSSFYWTGQIEGFSDFELRVNMIETDKLLNGQGSKIIGDCLFLNDYKVYSIEGFVKNNELLFNCIDIEGRMVYSFNFKNTDGRKTTQLGKWTDGSQVLKCTLETGYERDISKSKLLNYCVAVNSLRKNLDSTFSKHFNYLPNDPFVEIGEGYSLEKLGFSKSKFYGKDFLEFLKIIKKQDNTEEILKISWQLMQTNKTNPIILEIKSIKNIDSLKLQLNLYDFKEENLSKIDSITKFITAEDYYLGRNRMVFFSKNHKIIEQWKWNENRFTKFQN